MTGAQREVQLCQERRISCVSLDRSLLDHVPCSKNKKRSKRDGEAT